MKAAVCTRYGSPDVLEIKEMTKPTPKDKEVLIKVVASTVSSGDCRVRGGNFPLGFGILARFIIGVPRKVILGTELAGTVETVGKDVTRFKVGDPVIAFCGAGFGAHAEYHVVAESGLIVIKPEDLSFAEAASLAFGGTTALYFLRERANVQPGETVLIVGASGAVGSAAVQLARHLGADVTGVCSTRNVELVKSIGAHRVIDYTQSDFTKAGTKYDLIFDTTGTVAAPQCKDVLKDKGRLVLVAADLVQMLQPLWSPLKGGGKVLAGNTPERVEDLHFLTELASRGGYRPVIDRSFKFDQIVQAHAYVETGRKKGSVIISMV
jgi:NADPH:quinone reductase-like Zn-dependent oxidoreductase